MKIGIVNTKGGVGKTTSSIYLASAAAARGYEVTVWDADPQGSATEWAEIAGESGNPLQFNVIAVNCRTVQRRVPDTELVIVDTPTGSPQILDSVIASCDTFIVPTSPSAAEVQRVWATINMLTDKDYHVLATSVELNTVVARELDEVLAAEEVPRFRDVIVKRTGVRRSFGSAPDKLYGYDSVLDELLENGGK
ncbi:ParA family protein [Corynebacterium sp. CCM 9203]|uniref:ParA family protein n=1 Tax=Corynebacterium sp. CCM 9203 TaxID=3057615 RepID=UPI003525FCF2